MAQPARGQCKLSAGPPPLAYAHFSSGREVPAGDMPIPRFKPARWSRRFFASFPYLGRCMSAEMLMGPYMVVPAAELDQLGPQFVLPLNGNAVQTPFEGAEETLDPPVLPRAVHINGLQAYAEQRQCDLHCRRIETGLIVHTDAAWNAELTKASNQFTQEGNAAFVWQRRQPQACPAAVVEQPQHHVLMAGNVAFPGQVQRPYAVARHRPWHAVLEGAPQTNHLCPRLA